MATAPVIAPVAVVATLRIARVAIEGLPVEAAFDADVFAVAGFTVFGEAFPDVVFVFFFASLDRAAIAGPAPVFDCVALAVLPGADLPDTDFGDAFFTLVAIALFLPGHAALLPLRGEACLNCRGRMLAPQGGQRAATRLVPLRRAVPIR